MSLSLRNGRRYAVHPGIGGEKEGIDDLLEMILLVADMKELKGTPTVRRKAR